MDLLTVSLDVLFLILALMVLPSTNLLLPPSAPPTPTTWSHPKAGTEARSPAPTSPLPSPFLAVPGSAHSAPSSAPSSPAPAMAVPAITITPDRPAQRPSHSHKRKSVSFSISSLDDLRLPDALGGKNKKRPPTPFVSGPVSPAGATDASPAPSVPATPVVMGHNLAVVDPMGVKKAWLMA